MILYVLLMSVFGAFMYLYGIYIYYSRRPFIPKIRFLQLNKKERKRIGKSLMIISLAPLLSAIVAFLGNIKLTLALSWLLLIVIVFLAIRVLSKK